MAKRSRSHGFWRHRTRSSSRVVPLQRLGRPEEIAWAVVFVASDQANFMTGETLYVSGGPRVANREDTK
ncbi:MAG: hypothetical protein DMD97_17430 [Candidatus Rokuibacteriota bacterium]|nr:MAG: hypothetical protein DMD97_17430 [Candidatus Rokubacteria bacterium]